MYAKGVKWNKMESVNEQMKISLVGQSVTMTKDRNVKSVDFQVESLFPNWMQNLKSIDSLDQIDVALCLTLDHPDWITHHFAHFAHFAHHNLR